MRDQDVFRVDRLELYRTAREFVHVADRIEGALPTRKHDTRAMLFKHSGEIGNRIAKATAEVSRRKAFEAYRHALHSTTVCCDVLDRLHMLCMGGFADVTTGLELLERLFAGITQLMEDTRERGIEGE